MPFHFSDSGYVSRLGKTKEAPAKRSFDVLLMFAPESHYLICGYDTFGFAMFQCLILGADGQFDNGQAVLTAFNRILENAMGSSLSCRKINPTSSGLPFG